MVRQKYDYNDILVAGCIGAKPGISKTQLQKICYFLQELDQSNSRFRFVMYHYGPYSRDVTRATRHLEEFGVIDVAESEDGFGYRISPGKYFNQVDSQLSHGQTRLVDWLGQKTAWQLELIASAHFIRRILQDQGVTDVDRNRLTHEVRLVKPGYDEHVVGEAIDELSELEEAFRPEPATA